MSSVLLAAPTASGKTIMSIELIERLLKGTEDTDPLKDATFVWLSDSPSLNEQTRRKMEAFSSVMTKDRLVTITPGFDQAMLDHGHVYFLNTQKLGEEKLLTRKGDLRNYTIWDTLNNTIRDRPESLFLFVDEAHRGLGVSETSRKTTFRKFLEGSEELAAFPIVIGITATPERFQVLVEKQEARHASAVQVPPEDVRSSGLIKEEITLWIPETDKGVESDMTLLRSACAEHIHMSKAWKAYCVAEDERQVRPILVVQVEDKSKTSDSKTPLGELLSTIENVLGPLDDEEIAHSFGHGEPSAFGERIIRHIAPEDIEDQRQLKAVVFKSSLNTGWDCPRAEVMMSFRRAADATMIAQLVGRMVRTPLARSIKSDERLNAVTLYLPHYDSKALEKIVDYLTTETTVEVTRGTEYIDLERDTSKDDCFAILATVPSCVVPTVRASKSTVRLKKLGWLLATTDIDRGAPKRIGERIVRLLDRQKTDLTKDGTWDEALEWATTMSITGKSYTTTGTAGASMLAKTQLVDQDIDDRFKAAGRAIGGSFHKTYWESQFIHNPAEPAAGKLDLLAILRGSDTVLEDIEDEAKSLFNDLWSEHQAAVSAMPEGVQVQFDELLGYGGEPAQILLDLPDAIRVSKSENRFSDHVFVDSNGSYGTTLKGLEPDIVEIEMGRGDFHAWFRNPDRKDWALQIPYASGGVIKKMFPDFLFLRRTPDGIVVDLLDPHSHELPDAVDKVRGIADYARQHWSIFGRIESFTKIGGQLKRLELSDPAVREKALAVENRKMIEQLYAEYGIVHTSSA